MKIPNQFGMFRGVRQDNNEVVYGYYHSHKAWSHLNRFEHLIKTNDVLPIEYSVYPESLAACTTVLDKNDIPIYGSFPLSDGTMTKGGDVVLHFDKFRYDVVYDEEFARFTIDTEKTFSDFTDVYPEGVEIIGSQYAAAMGVEFREVGAAIATMTKQGVPTAQAATQLKAALVELQKPGKDLAIVMKKAGVSLESIDTNGLQVELKKLGEELEREGKSA